MPGNIDSIPGNIDNIEVVELSDSDLDLMLEAANKPLLTRAEIREEEFEPTDLSELDLFRSVDLGNEKHLLSNIQVFAMGPGYELLRHGQINIKVYFVLEGQLRIHEGSREGKVVGIVDIGQCVGLISAITNKPQHHVVIAPESSRVAALDITTIDEMTEQSHTIALNYGRLLTTHLQ